MHSYAYVYYVCYVHVCIVYMYTYIYIYIALMIHIRRSEAREAVGEEDGVVRAQPSSHTYNNIDTTNNDNNSNTTTTTNNNNNDNNDNDNNSNSNSNSNKIDSIHSTSDTLSGARPAELSAGTMLLNNDHITRKQ